MCGGELAGIHALIENEAADQWVRGAAVSCLVTLVAAGQKSRDEVVSYFARLFRGQLERKWSNVWDSLVSCSSELYPAELLDDIKRAYAEGLVDSGYLGLDDVKRDLALGKERVLARLADDSHWCLVEDTVEEMEWWACFQEEEPELGPPDAVPVLKKSGPDKSAVFSPGVVSQVQRTAPKIGRNDPCPCGSGKKYKKCCGA